LKTLPCPRRARRACGSCPSGRWRRRRRARERLLSATTTCEVRAGALDALRLARARPIARVLLAQLVDQRLLDLRRELQLARRRHVGRVGVDRLRLGEVDDRREGLGRLEHLEREALLARLERRRHAETPPPTIARSSTPAARAPWRTRLARDRLHGARAGVGRELQQRDAGQVADDVQPGHRGRAVGRDLGQPLDDAGRPASVEPLEVASQGAAWSAH
jgi:hypothetical protein